MSGPELEVFAKSESHRGDNLATSKEELGRGNKAQDPTLHHFWPKKPPASTTSGHATLRNSNRLSKSNLEHLQNTTLRTEKPLPPKTRTAKPGITASLYMEQAWEAASSQNYSVMSENTKRKLGPLFKWQDRHGAYLESCCSKGNPSAVKFLLEQRCNPGSRMKSRPNPLQIAIRGRSMRHNKCVQHLLDHGANVNLRSRRDGSTPLHWAIENPAFIGYTRHVQSDSGDLRD